MTAGQDLPDPMRIPASPFYRFAIALPLAVACIVGAVFYPLLRDAERHIRAEVRAAIEQEILALDARFHDHGLEALRREVDARIRSAVDADAIYLLLGGDGTRLAGNLAAWPEGAPASDAKWFRLKDAGGHYIEGEVFVLFGGERLLVGRRSPLAAFRGSMINRMWWSATLIILVSGLLTWVFMAHLHRRLSSMAAAARRIQEGALSDRLHVGAGGDELDELALRFNQAFDEIARRIESTQHVSTALAHDMRRPLTALHNALEEALAETPRDDPLHQRLEALAGQTAEQLHTFAALLRLARLEAGAWQGERIECDLAEIAADAIELYAPLAERHGRTISARLSPTRLAVDRALVFQLLQNLLENALHHGGGNIEVTVGERQAAACITVRDHGTGVPEAALARIFERFYQVDASRSGDSGSGIGLALVKGIAQAHAGQVRASNRGGLEIEVVLPLKPPAAAAA